MRAQRSLVESRAFFPAISYSMLITSGSPANSHKITLAQFTSRWRPYLVTSLRKMMSTLSISQQKLPPPHPQYKFLSRVIPMTRWLNSMSWQRLKGTTTCAQGCSTFLPSAHQRIFRHSFRNMKRMLLASTTNPMMAKQTMSTMERLDLRSKE